MCGPIVEVRQEWGEGGCVPPVSYRDVVPVIASDFHCNVDLCVIGDLVGQA